MSLRGQNELSISAGTRKIKVWSSCNENPTKSHVCLLVVSSCFQGVCPEIAGAFTGAVSASMLQSVGVQWALAGHSERRVIFGETDEYINGQVLKLLELGMSCMLCIGESESEFEQNLAGSVCAVQLKKGLAGVSKEDMSRIAIAYEPVWAIGTGKVATPEIAQSVHEKCRSILAEMYGQETADSTRILYGGSVTPESVDELMAQPDIDGALVGGASLDSSKFGRIINFKA
jgi:triosephosphate isomerase